jgi:hypothetical protein
LSDRKVEIHKKVATLGSRSGAERLRWGGAGDGVDLSVRSPPAPMPIPISFLGWQIRKDWGKSVQGRAPSKLS